MDADDDGDDEGDEEAEGASGEASGAADAEGGYGEQPMDDEPAFDMLELHQR